MARLAHDEVLRDGSARLLRFAPHAASRAPAPACVGEASAADRAPLLLVPSLINRWYVLDLDRGASLARALVEAGIDTFCLDWGDAGDEDRYLGWDDVVARLARAARAVRRLTKSPRIGVLGYCMGGTLAAIHAALEPNTCAALVNLLGPIAFRHAGILRHLVDRRWFDAEAIAAAGNVSGLQMQAGFAALRPTLPLQKIVRWLDADDATRARSAVLESWAADNVAFPAAAYARYIADLYQDDQLVRGEHRIAGRAVDLRAIRCPLLTIVADRDTICPPESAQALAPLTSSPQAELLTLRGGHVGAVVGPAAERDLYPALTRWLLRHLPQPHRPERRAPESVPA